MGSSKSGGDKASASQVPPNTHPVPQCCTLYVQVALGITLELGTSSAGAHACACTER